MPAAPIRFLFDFISPYAYLAWHGVAKLAATAGRAVAPEPVLFAALLDAHGHVGPAEIPAKRAYVLRDVLYKADALGVPVRPPPSHPFNPLLALRVAGLPELARLREPVITGLYRAVWGGGPGVEDPSAVATVVDEAGGDGQAAVEAARAPEAKARLRDATTRAIAEGVFGVPTMIVDGRLFWGVDNLPHVESHLAGRDPIDPAILEAWRDLPATAGRPRVPRRPHDDER